ncbi:MAG: alpha/beta hydrolase [Bacteroidota bacterium]|nr:alpha/beta hydrolase [Bacteroidota bacterium]
MKTRFLNLIFILFAICSCDKGGTNNINDLEYLKTTIQYKTLTNIDPNLLSLDVYYNNQVSNKRPLVIYVHGGGWSIGDKTSQLENKINLFRSLNYVFISINYRLSPFPFDTANTNRIKYPDHNNDVADALKWINDNIEQYGGDNNKMALLGHSAGAHLVALSGSNGNFLEQRGLSLLIIKGVAVIDTEGFDVLEQVENGDNQNMYINAFGTNTTENIDASPLYNITNGTEYPEFFIAKRGSAQRIGYANEFISKLENNGVEVYQVNGSIYTHEEINNAIGAPGEILITEPLKQFFIKCFE